MHITERAPVLSATSSTDCICIIVFSPKLFSNLTCGNVPPAVLEPVRVRLPPSMLRQGIASSPRVPAR
jgi:hypothetical protein